MSKRDSESRNGLGILQQTLGSARDISLHDDEIMKHICFWQNIPSIHQTALIRSLASHEGISVSLICEHDIPPWRSELGWRRPDFGNVEVILSPDDVELRAIIGRADSSTVHIFSGLRAYPLAWSAFQQISETDAIIGVQSEPAKRQGSRGPLRLMRGRVDRQRLDKKIDLILAIGHLGVKWFRMCGYTQQKVFPFGYFVETPAATRTDGINRLSTPQFQIIFIGQCIHRKGIDLLIKALSGLLHLDWDLTVVGDGVDRKNLMQLVETLGIDHRVKFSGALSNIETIDMLQDSDLLVLPSRWDGWGAVVNEALMSGVPVVCSDHCGAADLLNDSERGSIFPSDNIDALRQVIGHQLSRGKLTSERRNSIRSWSTKISGATAADYFLDVVQAVQTAGSAPIPPWL